MALYTKIRADEARAIGVLYGLEVTGSEGLKAGSVNSNVALTLADGERAFLRIYEEQGPEGAAAEAALGRHLAARGVPTPAAYERLDGGGSLAWFAGKPVGVFAWVAGSSRCTKGVRPSDAEAVGAALAAVHLAGSPTPRPGRFGRAQLEARCERIEREGGPDLAPLGPRLRAALAEADAARTPDAEVGLCHGDLFRDNVLFEGPRLAALLDFESAAEGRFAYDVAVTLLAWCYDDDFVAENASAMVRGYVSRRPLGAADRAALFGDARFAALRFAVTRVTDYAMRASSGEVEVRDWRRFWRRYERLGELGPGGMLRLIGLGR